MMISQKNGENVYNPLQLKVILNVGIWLEIQLDRIWQKKIGKTFIAHCGIRVNKQQESSCTYHKTRMSTQFLKDDFPETFPNMDMKTGKGKKKLRKDHNSHSLLKSRVAHFQSYYD